METTKTLHGLATLNLFATDHISALMIIKHELGIIDAKFTALGTNNKPGRATMY